MVDTQELEAKRQQLAHLKAKVAAQRAAIGRDGGATPPAGPPEKRPADGMALLLNVLAAKVAQAILLPLREKATPDEATIPGTNITESGIRRLLVLLQQRADTPEAGGRIVAKWLLAFLTRPPAAGETQVAGVNLEQLKQVVAFLDRVTGRTEATITFGAEVSEPAEADAKRIAEIEEAIRQMEGEIDALVERLERRARSSSPEQPVTAAPDSEASDGGPPDDA